MPKYSIILPTYNSARYLESAIASVLNIQYNNFEFIISDNCSSDNTQNILRNIYDSRVKIIKPDQPLNLAAHWNFALKHATGEWLYALGTDDAVMPYFFDLCDCLTEYCKKKNIKIIKSNRAYYFWQGVEDLYEDGHINYSAAPIYKILYTKKIMQKALKDDLYVDIPQMYLSSLFHSSVLKKACTYSTTKEILPNIPGISQDSYLSVIGCTFEKKYLYIEIPLGWVGTSSSSTGLKEGKLLNDNNLKTTDNITYPQTSYKFLRSGIYLLYEAFEVFKKNSTYKHKFKSRYLKPNILFANIYNANFRKSSGNRYPFFLEYLKKHHLNDKDITKRANLFLFFDKTIEKINFILNIPKRVLNKVIKIITKNTFSLYKDNTYSFSFGQNDFKTYTEINKIIAGNERMKTLIKEINRKVGKKI